MAQKKILVQLSTLFLFLLFLTLSCNKSEAADKTGESDKESS